MLAERATDVRVWACSDIVGCMLVGNCGRPVLLAEVVFRVVNACSLPALRNFSHWENSLERFWDLICNWLSRGWRAK
jgi:hypothetical protein